MNNYVDQYGRYHDKPVTEINPIPSNNSWIYTAYADKLGLPVDKVKLEHCFNQCELLSGVLIRSPGKVSPPMSRDEILGMAALGLLLPGHLDDWSFSPYTLPSFNPFKLVKQLWECKGQHRNYFWQNNKDQLYRFAFSVPLTDRHFILQQRGKFNVVYWAIAKVDSWFGEDSGIRWLKYGKSKEAMLEEFPEDHPFRKV